MFFYKRYWMPSFLFSCWWFVVYCELYFALQFESQMTNVVHSIAATNLAILFFLNHWRKIALWSIVMLTFVLLYQGSVPPSVTAPWQPTIYFYLNISISYINIGTGPFFKWRQSLIKVIKNEKVFFCLIFLWKNVK